MMLVHFPYTYGEHDREQAAFYFIDSLPLMEDGSRAVMFHSTELILFKNDEDALVFKLRFGL